MFDDFDLGPQCEEFYDDADYWESIMNKEEEDDTDEQKESCRFKPF
jgi:hypothetical protein